VKAHIYAVKEIPFGDGIWVHIHLVCFPNANMSEHVLLSYLGMVEDKKTSEVLSTFNTLNILFNGTNLSYDRAKTVCTTLCIQ